MMMLHATSHRDEHGHQRRHKYASKRVQKAELQELLLSLFFAPYQTHPHDYYDDDEEELEHDQTTSTGRLDKGKEKLTPEEEEALLLEEQESGEGGLLASSTDEDDEEEEYFPFDEDEYEQVEDDEHYYLSRFDVSDLIDDARTGHAEREDDYREEREDEEDDDVGCEEKADRWERRVVGYKSRRWVGGELRRRTRDLRRPRRRPGKHVNARSERVRCERAVQEALQFAAQKTNATRGLQYRTIDYWSIRQSISSSAPPPTASSHHQPRASSSSSRNHNRNDGRVPSYEREVTSAIDRGSHVDCGLTVQQLNDLLNRELTPEDYELLLMLDSTVKPKTVSANVIDSFPSVVLQEGSSLLAKMKEEEERCAICMSAFEAGETVKELPRCHHFFHAECITQWLSTASTKCPLCACSFD